MQEELDRQKIINNIIKYTVFGIAVFVGINMITDKLSIDDLLAVVMTVIFIHILMETCM